MILHLADIPGVLPVLARWFVEEWEAYYGPDGPGDPVSDLKAASDRDHLPLCLVAVDDEGRPLGTVALKGESVDSHRHLSPWLAALLVAPEHRDKGVGGSLIEAIESEARRLGFERLYTATDTANDLFKRRGWVAFDQAPTIRGVVSVYRLEFQAADFPRRVLFDTPENF